MVPLNGSNYYFLMNMLTIFQTQLLNTTAAINEPHKLESNKMNEAAGSSKLMKSLSDTNILSESNQNSIKPILSGETASLSNANKPEETSSGCSIM